MNMRELQQLSNKYSGAFLALTALISFELMSRLLHISVPLGYQLPFAIGLWLMATAYGWRSGLSSWIILSLYLGSQVTELPSLQRLQELIRHLSPELVATGAANLAALGYWLWVRSRRRVEQRKINEQLNRSYNYLSALQETTAAMTNRLDPGELFNGILARTGEALGTNNIFIHLVQPDRQMLKLEYASGIFAKNLGDEVARGEGLAGKAWSTGEPMAVADYDTWPGRLERVAQGFHHALACVPMKAGGRVIGILGVAYEQEEQIFDQQKLAVLNQIADLASVAVDNAELFQGVQRLASIVESSTDAIYATDPAGRVISWNDGARRLYGYFPEEVIGRSIEVIIPEGERARLTTNLARLKLGEQIRDYETLRQRKDGKIIEVSLNISPINDARGQMVGCSIIAHDITTRKEAQRALARSAAALREAQEIARVGSWEWDLSGTTVEWSDEMYRLYGLDPKTDVTYDLVSEMTHPSDRERLKAITQHSVQSGKPFEYDLRIIRGDGTYSFLHAQGRAEQDAEGKTCKLLGTVQDVTEQRLSEEIIRYNQEKLRSLIEGIKDYGILMLDTEGHITSWSAGAQAIKGYSESEVLGRHFSIFYTPEDLAIAKPEAELRIATKEGKYEEEGWRVRKGGERFYANVIITSLKDPNGSLRGFAKITRDITERHKLEQMKSDFISMVSHQLKTPLAIIRSYADNILLGITGPLNERQTQYVEEMREISDRYYGLIARLLSISRLERGAVPIDKQPIEISKLVTIIDRRHRGRIEQKGLELKVDGLSEPIMVDADAEKTIEAISNIVDNAVKFTQTGSISLLAGTDGHYGWIEVADTGPGMPEADVAKLFKRDQVFSGAPQAEGGTGLGLFIAKEFMSLQGGDIKAESTPGRGTKFTFLLPLAKVEVPKSEAPHES